VFASLDRGGQIAVGVTTGDHEDFEGYSGESDEEIARAAFDCFVDLLRTNGHLVPRPDNSLATVLKVKRNQILRWPMVQSNVCQCGSSC
jgi:hypothetical protein